MAADQLNYLTVSIAAHLTSILQGFPTHTCCVNVLSAQVMADEQLKGFYQDADMERIYAFQTQIMTMVGGVGARIR